MKPAAYIASFSPFLHKNIEVEGIKRILNQEFDNFFVKNILPYGELKSFKVGLVGSIAYNYADIIKHSAKNFNIEISSIIKNPIPYLEKYFIGK